MLLDLGDSLFEFGHAFLTEDIGKHDFLIKAAERFAEERDVVGSAVFPLDDLGN